MTVTEYREKHPNCEYCFNHPRDCGERCEAIGKKMSERTAKKCPCYIPRKWEWDEIAKEIQERELKNEQ